jgi:hypothetical protein
MYKPFSSIFLSVRSLGFFSPFGFFVSLVAHWFFLPTLNARLLFAALASGI